MMRKSLWAAAVLAAFPGLPAAAGEAVGPKVPIRAYPFDLGRVALLDGPYLRARELDRKYLLSLDVDRLLHTFRINAGLPSTAAPLGGWEEPKGELRGHFPGHYMTACALLYAATGDERLKEKGRKMVAGLAECQAKIGSGYLSAYPEEFLDRVEALKPVWAPWYTLHKILAGLLDQYAHCGDRQALEVARKFGDWVKARTDRLDDDRMEKMLGNEHGGINESLANLYALTGEEKYLKTSLRFNHEAVIEPAKRREDRLTGLHANTQIPKFVGTAVQYELTGDESLRTASSFFWDTVVKERSYVIGGHSDGEAFSPKERLSEAFGPSTTETCNTYNMLKLTRHLFSWDPRVEYADYYERALLNHILCSQNPETGMMCYYVPLRPGSRKEYNTPEHSFWCCTGTGVENHAKYGDSIYFHDGGKGLWVNLFIASELAWTEKGVKVRQDTRYPDEGKTRLTFSCASPADLSLRIRRPAWAGEGFRVTAGGAEAPLTGGPGTWAVLDRTFRDGDVVEVEIPLPLRTEGFRDNPRRFAFLQGPTVLAAEVEPGKPFPAIVTDEAKVVGSLASVAGKAGTFRGSPEAFRIPGGEGKEVILEPFFRIHGNRHYVVYWDLFSAQAWTAKEAEVRAEMERRKELEARTVDSVTPGFDQEERDHGLAGDRTSAGDFGGRKWRHAPEGWFSWRLKVLPGQPADLAVTYWGSDFGRVFDVLVDGQKVATQRLQGNRPDRFYEEIYSLPAALTAGKESVTVRFQAGTGSTAGGVFGVRILKKA